MNYKEELKEAFNLILTTDRINILEKWVKALPPPQHCFEVGGRVAITIFVTQIGPEIKATDADTQEMLDLSLLPGEQW